MDEVMMGIANPEALYAEICGLIEAFYAMTHGSAIEGGFHRAYPNVYKMYLGLAALGYGKALRRKMKYGRQISVQ